MLYIIMLSSVVLQNVVSQVLYTCTYIVIIIVYKYIIYYTCTYVVIIIVYKYIIYYTCTYVVIIIVYKYNIYIYMVC